MRFRMARDDVVVGFIGLGIMGGRMVANLQKAGYKLVVHDLQRQAASDHLNAGAAWADSPRALAGRSDVIFSSLPEPPDVEAVALGPDGLIAGMKPGTAYFDLSTNSPSVVKKLHAAFAEKGLHMLDAPVSGGPSGATFDALIDQFLPGEYDPPAFALKLAHKDVSLANALGRELGMPMRLCNLALAEMTEALARGWGGRDSARRDAPAAGTR